MTDTENELQARLQELIDRCNALEAKAAEMAQQATTYRQIIIKYKAYHDGIMSLSVLAPDVTLKAE